MNRADRHAGHRPRAVPRHHRARAAPAGHGRPRLRLDRRDAGEGAAVRAARARGAGGLPPAPRDEQDQRHAVRAACARARASWARSRAMRSGRAARRPAAACPAPPPTCSGPGCGWCSAASTRAASPRPPRRTSRTRATTSGGSSTRRASHRGSSCPPSSTTSWRTAAASPTPPRAPTRGLGRPAARRLRRAPRSAWSGSAWSCSPRFVGLRGQGSLARRVRPPHGLGLQASRLGPTAAVRAAVHVAGQRGRPVRRERLRWFSELRAARGAARP